LDQTLADLKDRQTNNIMRPGMHIHLVGIGGTGLSAIAKVLIGHGYVVSGSDRQQNALTADLADSGATVFAGHKVEHVNGADLLLVSSAIPADNPEIQAAERAGIPIMKRNEFLGYLLADSYAIAVAGTHGKTTTTGMIAEIMIAAGKDPSLIVGAVLPSLGSNGRSGQSDYFVIEADEYDYMFLGLTPSLAVVTNVEYDHPDLFRDAGSYQQAFRKFASKVQRDGWLFACGDDPGSSDLANYARGLSIPVYTYGIDHGDWQAADIRPNQLGGSDFLVHFADQLVGVARLRVPGEHNVRNALAAIAVASELGIDFDEIRPALASFGGLNRRFQLIGGVADVIIIDDYAHHPTEIQVTLAAARQRFPGRRLWAVWQPHTFSRTRVLMSEFAACFELADRVVALDIFRSREQDELDIDTAQVVAGIQGARADHVGSITEAANFVLERVLPGDVILTLSAGDGNQVGRILLQQLEKREADKNESNEKSFMVGNT